MSKDLETMAEAYLDGFLSPEKKAEFESALLTDEGSEALSQALMFRYLMGELLPKEVDEELLDSIHANIMKEFGQQVEEGPSVMESIRDSFMAIGHAFNGPKAALSSASNTSRDLRVASKGAENISYSLGLLRQPMIDKSKELYEKRPSFWKVAWKLLRR